MGYIEQRSAKVWVTERPSDRPSDQPTDGPGSWVGVYRIRIIRTNPNNLEESEFKRKRIVPCLINQIEIMNIQIRLLTSRIGVCSIRVIPIRNRIHCINIPYEPNSSQIFQRVKYMALIHLMRSWTSTNAEKFDFSRVNYISKISKNDPIHYIYVKSVYSMT